LTEATPDDMPQARSDPRRSKHERAVANTLDWADRAAANGEYAEALAWLEMLDAIEAGLPPACIERRSSWARAAVAIAEEEAERGLLALAEPNATERILALGHELEALSDAQLLLDRALEGATAFLGTDLGNIQLRDGQSGALAIATSSGFDSEFLQYFATVEDDGPACGRAAQNRSQVVIPDVQEDPGFAPHRDIARASGFRAVQSTPIVDPTGVLRGMISTHFRDRHCPSPSQLLLIDWLGARVGASLHAIAGAA